MKSLHLSLVGVLIISSMVFSLKSEARSPKARRVDVSSIKKNYWSKGDETEMGVVQNRQYTKRGKFSLGVGGGATISDPFMNILSYNVSAGYHLNEYWGLELVAQKYLVSGSTALQTLEESLSGATANTNIPRYYVGLEGSMSAMYGKLSVFGASIIYYDFFLTGGVGATNTESGTYVTPTFGIGQRYYLNRYLSLKLNYRAHYYRENIIEKTIPTKLGQTVGERDNFGHNLTLGVDFMFGFGGDK